MSSAVVQHGEKSSPLCARAVLGVYAHLNYGIAAGVLQQIDMGTKLAGGDME